MAWPIEFQGVIGQRSWAAYLWTFQSQKYVVIAREGLVYRRPGVEAVLSTVRVIIPPSVSSTKLHPCWGLFIPLPWNCGGGCSVIQIHPSHSVTRRPRLQIFLFSESDFSKQLIFQDPVLIHKVKPGWNIVVSSFAFYISCSHEWW